MTDMTYTTPPPLIIEPEKARMVDNAVDVDEFHDSQHAFRWDHELGRPVAVKGEQHIPDHILDDLNIQRTESGNKREGDMMKIASIPVVVVDKWMREGFDVFKHSAKEIVARLKAEDLGHFMATTKRI